MAHIHRLIRAFIIICTLLAGHSVYASFPASGGWTSILYPSAWSDTKVGACANGGAAWAAQYSYTLTYANNAGTGCYYGGTYVNTNGVPQNVTAGDSLKSALSCPANSTINSTSCTCNFGYEENGNACVRQDPCKRAHPEGGWEESGGTCIPSFCKSNEIRVNGACVPDPDFCPDGKTKKRADGSCPKPACNPDGPPKMITRSASMPSALCEDGCVYMKSNASTCSPDVGCGTAYYPTGSSCNTNNNDPQPPKDPASNPNGGDNNNNGNNNSDNKGHNGDNTGGGGNIFGNKPDSNGGCRSNEFKANGKCFSNDPPKKDPDSNGNCEPKYTKVNGVCVGNQPPKGGGLDSNKDPTTGAKSCNSGYYLSGDYCYPNQPPRQCPAGQTMDSSGGCTGTPNGNGDCPPNYTKMGGVCVGNQPGKDGDSDKDFCKQNPDLSLCKKGSFSGSCGNFQCDGDALQCAIAMDQHTRNCQMFNDASDESNLYGAEKGKAGNQTGNLPGNESKSIGANQIDASNALGAAGTCVQDLSVEVWRSSVTLPFSRLCPYLQQMGNILVAVAFLIAIKIVGRG